MNNFPAQPAQIRLASEAEAASVHALLLEATEEIPLTIRFAQPDYLDFVLGLCRQKRVWVAQIGDDMAGMIAVNLDEISYLAISSAFRGIGLARALVRHACDVTGGETRVEVWESNKAMKALLTSESFRFDGTIEKAFDGRTIKWEQYVKGVKAPQGQNAPPT